MEVDIPDMRTTFESAVRCETVIGWEVDDSKRSDVDSQVRRVLYAINQPLTRSGKWCKGRKRVHDPLMKCAVNGLRM